MAEAAIFQGATYAHGAQGRRYVAALRVGTLGGPPRVRWRDQRGRWGDSPLWHFARWAQREIL